MTTRFAKNQDGESIAYRVVGDGDRDIVLLVPGQAIDLLPDDPVFAAVEARLASLGRLIYFDWRGFGSSDPLVGLPTPEGWMDDTRVVLDTVGSSRAVVIAPVANGTMGLLFAATYPQRTSALVLIDTWARMAWAEDHPIGFSPERLEGFIDLIEAASAAGTTVAVDVPGRAGEPGFAAWHARLTRLTVPQGDIRRNWEWNLRVDARPALGAITAPTLVLHHERNHWVPLCHGRHLAESIGGARLEVLAGPPDNFFFGRTSSRLVLDHLEAFVTGAPPLGEVDRMLATVVFTDIVDSTAAAVRLGDSEWRRVLDAHDHLVATLLTAHRGRLVKSTGDGVLATFDGPGRAVRCARAIADAAVELGIEVRGGVHTGEVEVRGEDIGGIGVHIGARIAALAAAGEVLVSSTVRDLVTGSGLEFDDRGRHELKGLPEPWAVYALR